MAGGKFWVDFCASFGSLYGSDAYSRFAYVHRVCLARAAACPLLEHYVDNYIDFTPARTDPEETKREDRRLKKELRASGIRYHEFQDPTTRLTFLGWIIDAKNDSRDDPREERMDDFFSRSMGRRRSLRSRM